MPERMESCAVPLTLSQFRRCLQPCDALLPLDDPRVVARKRSDEKAARLLDLEKKRLSALEKHERKARKDGHRVVVGVDEVGRGPLAGPLVAAAVWFQRQPWIPLLDDSKKLTVEEREALFDLIFSRAASVAIGVVSVEEMNVTNMHLANLLAMQRAVRGLAKEADCLLVDGRHSIPDLLCAQRTLVKGDTLSISIAAASVIAKVTRDRHMDQMHERYPQYGFRQNKGYSTREHLSALREHGPTPIHRTGFAPVACLLERAVQLELI